MIYRVCFVDKYYKKEEGTSAIFVESDDVVTVAKLGAAYGEVIEIKAYKTAPRRFMGERIDPHTIKKIDIPTYD